MRSNIAIPKQGYWGKVIEQRPMFRNLTEEQIELIMQSRLADLDNIRIITLYSIAPLILLSFAGGYSIASLGLKPLEDLKEEISNRSSENLGKEIKFEDKNDEISDLIKSFNRMSRRLNNSFEAQKEFVENASHEIKTPLAVIQANLDTALEDGDISKKELVKLLESSKESVKFMDKLTEDLLLLSVLEHELATEKIDLNKLVKEIVDQSNVLKSDSKTDIEIISQSNISLIQGNEILLKRAFMNIIENAIKYSQASKIEIKLKENKNGEIGITIKDNGIGIPKEHIEKVFDRFYRVDKSRSRNTGGTGLGLSITKKIIERHNADITVKTERKKGVEFIIFFRTI
jgi:signal transduction histidine kinase